MELGKSLPRKLPPGNSAVNAARRVLRISCGGLGELGATPVQTNAAAPYAIRAGAYPVQIPAGGMTILTDTGMGSGWRNLPVPATIPDGSGGSMPNPFYFPPGYTMLGQAQARGIKPQWTLPIKATKQQFFDSRPIGVEKTVFVTDNFGAKQITYFSSPQYEADLNLWYAVGRKLGFITTRHDWTDTLGTAVEYAIAAVAVIGLAYGGYLAFAQAAGGGAAAASSTSAAASDAGTLYAPAAASSVAPDVAASAIMPGAQAVASGATGGVLSTGATATALTASGVASGLKTAKDIYGVANTIRALMRKPMGGAPLPTLDSSYGNGGFSAPLTQSAPSFFQGNNLLWLGGGIIAVLATVVLMQSKKRGKA